jgi:predicted alpha/beta hydrolase family esterase
MTLLILPGGQGVQMPDGFACWRNRPDAAVVEQNDFAQPLRGDWLARLDAVVVDTPGGPGSILLAAHHLGCVLVAAWAAVSRHTARIRGALLLDPLDVDRPDLPMALQRWAPVPRQRLPFATLLAAFQPDLHCSAERARALARDWGSCPGVAVHGPGPASCHCGWPEGHALLHPLKD